MTNAGARPSKAFLVLIAAVAAVGGALAAALLVSISERKQEARNE
jgi:hypothetical protein